MNETSMVTHAHDGGELCADGHTNSDFALPLVNGVVQHPVRAQACQRHGHNPKE
ncbi:MAG TPA: hypothetical protein VM709_14135 [Candidatus Sulfotelmatobacter sp.]|nr:hypothetical protein [Candidatus Sulfotelmatobacter sp.]